MLECSDVDSFHRVDLIYLELIDEQSGYKMFGVSRRRRMRCMFWLRVRGKGEIDAWVLHGSCFRLCLPSHLVLISVLGETPRVEFRELKITSYQVS